MICLKLWCLIAYRLISGLNAYIVIVLFVNYCRGFHLFILEDVFNSNNCYIIFIYLDQVYLDCFYLTY